MFCPGCGTNLFGSSSSTATYKTGRERGTRPVSDVRLLSFLLGLILGLIGLVLALIIYSGKDFEESPTGTVILWCIFGMFFWFIVLAVIAVMILGVSLTM